MRVYLDNCCFNRPFDDQSQLRIRLETETKLEIQERVRDGRLELVWSYILDYENQANPFDERREAIARWKALSADDVAGDAAILTQAREIAGRGIRPVDALHLACAISARCTFFFTTDDLLLKRARELDMIRAMNPTQFVVEVE